MLSHILVPLDGSGLAECVLPHVVAIARSTEARVTLLQALEKTSEVSPGRTVSPLDWHFVKVEAGKYLDATARRLLAEGVTAETAVCEGQPAESIVDYARQTSVDLIVLSSHGQSGLSGWNISSVVQKIILRSSVSTYLVRAYLQHTGETHRLSYQQLLVGLDGSTRAECAIPVAQGLAKGSDARLILAHVACKPSLLRREPFSEEDVQLVEKVVQRNKQEATRYLEKLASRLASEGVTLETHLKVGENPAALLHDLAEEEKADLVVLAAHGYTGDIRRLYGTVATSFIVYGKTPLLVVQDLRPEEIQAILQTPTAPDRRKH